MIDRRSYTEYASAARTTAQSGPKRDGRRVRGLMIYLDVTAAGAGGGLTLSVVGYGAGGTKSAVFTASAAVATTGQRLYVMCPDGSMSAAAGVTQVANLPVPFEYSVDIAVGNADSYTYSVKVETF